MKLNLSRKQRSIIVIGLVAAAGIAAYAYWSSRATAEEYMTGKVDRGDIRNTVSATGALQAVTTVQVGSQVSGTIQALFADFNSEVKKGQVIAQLDPAILQAQLSQSRASLEQARADLIEAEARLTAAKATVESQRAGVSGAAANVAALKAQRDDAMSLLNRQEALAAGGIVTQRDLESARTSYQAAEARHNQAAAQLEQARVSERSSAGAGLAQAEAQVLLAKARIQQSQASLQLAEVNLSHTTIRSPVDGVVISRNVDVGQTVAASLQAPTLFTIANDLTQMQVIANIDQADIGLITSTVAVGFTVDAFPGRTFSGTIRQIRLDPQNVQNVITYNVVIDVRNPDLKLLPGMTANLTATIAERKDVLKIPNAALRFLPQGMTQENVRELIGDSRADTGPTAASNAGRQAGDSRRGGQRPSPGASDAEGQARIVWVLGPDRKPQPRRIRTGITDGVSTEVIEGDLQQGDTVIIGQTISGNSTQTSSGGQSAPRLGSPTGSPRMR